MIIIIGSAAAGGAVIIIVVVALVVIGCKKKTKTSMPNELHSVVSDRPSTYVTRSSRVRKM